MDAYRCVLIGDGHQTVIHALPTTTVAELKQFIAWTMPRLITCDPTSLHLHVANYQGNWLTRGSTSGTAIAQNGTLTLSIRAMLKEEMADNMSLGDAGVDWKSAAAPDKVHILIRLPQDTWTTRLCGYATTGLQVLALLFLTAWFVYLVFPARDAERSSSSSALDEGDNRDAGEEVAVYVKGAVVIALVYAMVQIAVTLRTSCRRTGYAPILG